MRHGVMALNQSASNDIACFGRATFNELCSMNVSFAAFLSVDYPKLTDFGAVMPRNVEQSTIANLSSHFGVTRRLIEHHIDLVSPISRQHSFGNCFGLQKIVAEKFRWRTF